MDGHEFYKEIRSKVDEFSDPIDHLNHVLSGIPDKKLRHATLRPLGELIGNLEEVAYEFRKHLGTTSLF